MKRIAFLVMSVVVVMFLQACEQPEGGVRPGGG